MELGGVPEFGKGGRFWEVEKEMWTYLETFNDWAPHFLPPPPLPESIQVKFLTSLSVIQEGPPVKIKRKIIIVCCLIEGVCFVRYNFNKGIKIRKLLFIPEIFNFHTSFFNNFFSKSLNKILLCPEGIFRIFTNRFF